MKQHEWVVFGQREAEEVEKIEVQLDSEASNRTHGEPKLEQLSGYSACCVNGGLENVG